MTSQVQESISNRQLQQNGFLNHNSATLESSDLERSVESLLSQSSERAPDLTTRMANDYRKAAKLFIVKKFAQSFRTVSGLTEDSITFYEQNLIETKLFVRIWSLYFNLVGLHVNEDVKQLEKSELENITSEFLDQDFFFDKLYNCEKVIPPKIIIALLLIKMNNSQLDLIKVREKIDVYLVNASRMFNPAVNEEEYNDFKDLLELYSVDLMAKLGEYEEGENLIRSNPDLVEKEEELVDKLKQLKIKQEQEAELRELEKVKKAQAALAQKKREQEIQALKSQKREQRKIKESSNSDRNGASKPDQSLNTKTGKDLTLIEILKKRILKLATQKVPVLALIFALVSLLTFSKTFSLIKMNRRVKEQLQFILAKTMSTLKMAFQVTYV